MRGVVGASPHIIHTCAWSWTNEPVTKPMQVSSSKFTGTSRSNSLASTISSSGASLSRRSRTTRKRTRTITNRPDETRAEEDQVLDISAANSTEPFPGSAPSVSSEHEHSPVTTPFETRSSPISSPVSPPTNGDPERSGGVVGDDSLVVKQDAVSPPVASQLLASSTPTSHVSPESNSSCEWSS